MHATMAPALLALVLTALAAAPQGTEPGAADPPRLMALLVGCSEYPALREALGAERYAREVRLDGPPRDAALMRATLERVLGLEARGTTLLAGWGEDPATRPTHANILAALERLATDARPGSRAVVYLAGHGSQQPVRRASADEPDGLDELFLPADAARARDGWIPNAIRDDELGERLCAIRDAGADVWLVVDSCHSGTMLRGAEDEGVRLRWLDPAALGVGAPRARRGAPQSGWIGRSEPRIAASYGSQSYGRAPEMPIPREGGEVRGLFTWLLCQELERTRGRVSYQELSARVVAAYQSFPCSLTVPSAEGDLAREVASGAARDEPPLVCALRGGEPWLSQGRFAGLEPGTRVSARADEAQGGRALARLEVVEAEAFAARCRVLEGALEGSGPFAARVEERAGGDWSLALAAVRPEGTPLAADGLPGPLRRALEEGAERLRLVAPADADWQLVVPDDGRAWLRPGPREGGHDLPEVAPETLARRLRSLQTTRNLRRTASAFETPGGAGELDVWIERKGARGRAQRVEAGGTVQPGDEIRVRLEKRGARIWDVNAFWLDANLLRQCLCARRLEAEVEGVLDLTDWVRVTDDALGLEQLLVLATPRAPADPRLDLSWLADDATLRGERASPLERLLADAAGGGDLRGRPVGASAELDATASRLVGVRTAWGPLRPPPWPEGERLALSAAPSAADGLPDPWAAGGRAMLVRSRADGPLDTLLVGDEAVRAVFLDLDGASGLDEAGDPAALARALEARRFDAEAVFLFADDGRTAWYASGADGLDRALVDRDEDGTAEELWRREGGSWRVTRGMALSWLSQQHLARRPGAARERTARLALLQAGEEAPR